MTAKELTLNIAVNLGRIGRWACEGRQNRMDQFLQETEGFIYELEKIQKTPRFEKTFHIFKTTFDSLKLKKEMRLEPAWAEMMFTWADILTHRAELI